MAQKRKNEGADSNTKRQMKRPRKALSTDQLKSKLMRVARPVLVKVATELGINEIKSLTVPNLIEAILERGEKYAYGALDWQKAYAKNKKNKVDNEVSLANLGPLLGSDSVDEPEDEDADDPEDEDADDPEEEDTDNKSKSSRKTPSNPDQPSTSDSSGTTDHSDNAASPPHASDAAAPQGSAQSLSNKLQRLSANSISLLQIMCATAQLSKSGGKWELIGRVLDHMEANPTSPPTTRPRKPHPHLKSAAPKQSPPADDNSKSPSNEAAGPPDTGISNSSSTKDSIISPSAAQTPPDVETRDMHLHDMHQYLLNAEANFLLVAVEVRGLIDERGGISMPDSDADADADDGADDTSDTMTRRKLVDGFLTYLNDVEKRHPGIAVRVRELVNEQGRVWTPNTGASTEMTSSADVGSEDPNETTFTGDLPDTADLKEGGEGIEEGEGSSEEREEDVEEREDDVEEREDDVEEREKASTAHATSPTNSPSPPSSADATTGAGVQPDTGRPSFGGKGVAGKRLPQKRPAVEENTAVEETAVGEGVNGEGDGEVEENIEEAEDEEGGKKGDDEDKRSEEDKDGELF